MLRRRGRPFLSAAALLLGYVTVASSDGPRGRLRNIQFALPEAPPIVRGAWYGQELQGAPAAQSSHSAPPCVPTRATQPTVADCIAATLHGFKTGGYFIDLAANDAVTLSNSYTLEQQYGWKGLCVEPNPEYHTRLLQIRSCEVIAAAVSSREGQAFFEFNHATKSLGHRFAYSNGVFGRLTNRNSSSTTPVWTIPFSRLLMEHHTPTTIDFMSLDCEGNEAAVMETFPWETHTISVLSTEHPKPPLIAKLIAHGYKALCFVGNTDTVFVHWATMKEAVLRLVPALANGIPSAIGGCHALLFPKSGTCAEAMHAHRRTKYRVTGKLPASKLPPAGNTAPFLAEV